MFNRRQFLEGSVGAGLLAGWIPGVVMAQGAAGLPYREVIVDHRFPLAMNWGRLLAARGAQMLPIAGDVTDVWNRHLRIAWLQKPAALAGITLDETLFTLELVARDAGLRLVHRSELAVPAAEGVAAAACRASEEITALDPCSWTQIPARLGPSLTGGRRDTPDLVAWVLAPRAGTRT